MSDIEEIELDVSSYSPRISLLPFHKRKQRFALIVAHRRCGKTVAVINDLVNRALNTPKKNAKYGYFCPFYSQAKEVAWVMLKEYTEGIAAHCKYNESETSIVLPNGSKIRLYGADKPDSHRGLGFDGVVLDEFGDMKSEIWTKVVSTALRDRKGWATFIGTPKGKNKFWDLLQTGINNPVRWYTAVIKYSETMLLPGKPGAADGPPISPEEYEDDCSTKTDDEIAQEYECSFDAAITGSYYGKWINAMVADGRVTNVPYDDQYPVYTAWDIGWKDDTVIWFFQLIAGEIRIFDYYTRNRAGPDEFADDLADKGYAYGTMYLPKDAQAHTVGGNTSMIEQMLEKGFDCEIVKYHYVHDGITVARRCLPALHFDEERCNKGIEHLKAYQQGNSEKPVHDIASHTADAFRYLCMSLDQQYVYNALPKDKQKLAKAKKVKKFVPPKPINKEPLGYTLDELFDMQE